MKIILFFIGVIGILFSGCSYQSMKNSNGSTQVMGNSNGGTQIMENSNRAIQVMENSNGVTQITKCNDKGKCINQSW